MKWIFSDEFINTNNVNKVTFDTHWSPQGVGVSGYHSIPVLCVDMYVNVDGEACRHIHKCKYKQFDVSKLEDKFAHFLGSNLVHVFDFHGICTDIEVEDENIHNR